MDIRSKADRKSMFFLIDDDKINWKIGGKNTEKGSQPQKNRLEINNETVENQIYGGRRSPYYIFSFWWIKN